MEKFCARKSISVNKPNIELDSVKKWLKDLRTMTESECMCVLQGKSLLSKETEETQLPVTSIKSGIDTVRNESHLISSEFSKLFKFVESEKWKNVRPYSLQVTCHIRSLIHECNKSLPDQPSYILEQEEMVMGECAKLVQQVECLNSAMEGTTPVKIPLVNQLTFLGQAFSRLIDLVLGNLIQQIVDSMDEAQSPIALTSAIKATISLGLEGEHMCYILSREGGVHSLLDVCRSESLEFAHASALRALATICCVAESILELEREGGVECLTDILCDGTSSEAVKGEAAGVIAQITSPCLDNFHHIGGFVENLEDLLRSLMNLCYTTSSIEIFLLAAAAVANITFMDSMACEILLHFEAPQVLIYACSTRKAESLFAMDQVATVLANMAAVDSCRHDIISNNGIELMLHFLQERPSTYKLGAEVSACERLQQKAAIALTRLCRDLESARAIVDIQGIPRLVQLCREVHERNNSDAVLVACLAALRKICSLCQVENMTAIDFQQLIKPRLMDSFLMCSHSDENFV